MSESQKTISQSEWTKLRNCIEALKLASRELGGSLGETCDIEYHVALRVFRDVESADKNPSNSQAPITPAAIALLNAERVRGQMAAYGPDFNTPEVGEAKAREIGPHTLELCRLAVEQWYRCSPTPQPLSTTMIRMRDAVIFAAQEERDELSRRNQAGHPGEAAAGPLGGAGTEDAADLGPRAAGQDGPDQPGEVPGDHATDS